MDDSAKLILTENRALIGEIHTASESENLRHLRQALLDFERIIGAIGTETRNPEMLRELLTTFLIYTFEIRSGHIRPEYIYGLGSWASTIKGENGGIIAELHRKYPAFRAPDSVFSAGLWVQIVDKGFIDRQSIEKAIAESRFYAREGQRPDWLRLNGAFEMEDGTLSELVRQVESNLAKKDYLVLGELMHVTGSMISLSSIGIGKLSKDKIVALALANVEQLKNNELIPLSAAENEIFGPTGWAGRSFQGADEPEFAVFLEGVDRIKNDAKIKSYPATAEKLLNLLQTKDTASFSAALYFNRDGTGQYAREPVLAYMKPVEFVDAVDKLSAKQLTDILQAFDSRYETRRIELLMEKDWLKQVAACMVKKCGSMSDFYRRRLRDKVISSSESIDSQTLRAEAVRLGE